ncbi:MAG: DDE-type integrase/transposase/recombinase [Lentisphaeria bacterium]|nr:DDE-type integrase/transposase/recombinase [Lentisphaeria bacterium]
MHTFTQDAPTKKESTPKPISKGDKTRQGGHDVEMTQHDLRQKIALFRYGLISDLAQMPQGAVGLYKRLQERAERTYDIPGSRRTHVAAETLRGWLRDYRRGGFDALFPKARTDIGRARNLPQVVVDLLCETKEEHPDLSTPLAIKYVREHFPERVPEDLKLPTSTVHRLLARRGLTSKGRRAESKDRRHFQHENAGDLWMCDVMHGPRVLADGRRRKAYLIAFIDDATRLVPYAEFKLSEGIAAFLPVFEKAIRKRGIPKRLYVDNGSAFRSHQLRVACAQLGIVLIHAKPYSPQGKGKIERWFRTVRLQLLPMLTPDDTASLEGLNRRLFAWVEGEYHLTPHRGIDRETPSDRWARLAGGVRSAPDDVASFFRIEKRRKVAKDRTITLDGVLFEVDAALIGQTIILRYDASRAPNKRTLEVVFEGQIKEHVKPLDAFSNCFVKRASAVASMEVDPDAPQDIPEGLAMRDLDKDTSEVF